MALPKTAPTAAPTGPPTAAPIAPPTSAPATGSPWAEAWVEKVPSASAAEAVAIQRALRFMLFPPLVAVSAEKPSAAGGGGKALLQIARLPGGPSGRPPRT